MWVSRCHRSLAGHLQFGDGKESAEGPAFLRSWRFWQSVWRQHLHIWCQSGCTNQVCWTSCCVPVPAPSPSSGLQPAYKTGMLPSTSGKLFSSGGGREEGNGAINSPSRLCSVHLPWRQPLGTDDSFVSMGNSKGCTICQGCFLIT